MKELAAPALFTEPAHFWAPRPAKAANMGEESV
jgi:hypothetical protein